MTPIRYLTVVLGVAAAGLFAQPTFAQDAKPGEARNVVLVHGAWADGSSWSEVISQLHGLSPEGSRRHDHCCRTARPITGRPRAATIFALS
jgi:hypothetical protein